MSTILNTITTCPNLQGWLADYFATCPASRRPGSPLFNFLFSDANRFNLRDLRGAVNPVPGRKRTVELVYDQPVSTSDVLAVPSCDRICDATTERGDASVTYTIECTDGFYVEEQWRLSDWNESCRSDGDILIRKLANMLDGLMARVYQATAEAMPPLLGGWSSDVNPLWIDADDFLEVSTEKASSDDLNVQAYQRIANAKMQSGYCLPTFIVGGIDLYGYWQLMNAGCCTQDGIDALAILNQLGETVTYDRWVAAEFGNDVSLMLQAGSLQLLTYNAVTPLITNLGGLGDLDMTYRNYFEAIINDPLTGFPVDLSIKSDCGVVDIVMTATSKPVALPFTLYPEGHINDGVNFASAIQVVNT